MSRVRRYYSPEEKRDLRQALSDVYPGLAAAGYAVRYPKVPTEVADKLSGSEAGFMKAGAASDAFTAVEKTYFGGLWTAMNKGASAMIDTSAFQRSFLAHGVDLANAGSQVRDVIQQAAAATSPELWSMLQASDKYMPGVMDRVYNGLGSAVSKAASPAVAAIQSKAMAAKSSLSSAFATPIGGLVAAGIGVMAVTLINAIFTDNTEKQEMHKWYDAVRYRRVSTYGNGCFVVAECKYPSGGNTCAREATVAGSAPSGYGAGMDIKAYGNFNIDFSQAMKTADFLDQTNVSIPDGTSSRWVAWMPGGFGFHQGQLKFPSSPPWYLDAMNQMLSRMNKDQVFQTAAIVEYRRKAQEDAKKVAAWEAGGKKGWPPILFTSKITESQAVAAAGQATSKKYAEELWSWRKEATGKTWIQAEAQWNQTYNRLDALGVPKSTIETVGWLYWFTPLPANFGDGSIVPSWQSLMGMDVSVVPPNMLKPGALQKVDPKVASLILSAAAAGLIFF